MKKLITIVLVIITFISCSKDSDSSSCGCNFQTSDLTSRQFTPISIETSSSINMDFCTQDFIEFRTDNDFGEGCLIASLTSYDPIDCTWLLFDAIPQLSIICGNGVNTTRSDLDGLISLYASIGGTTNTIIRMR